MRRFTINGFNKQSFKDGHFPNINFEQLNDPRMGLYIRFYYDLTNSAVRIQLTLLQEQITAQYYSTDANTACFEEK